jgi:uncharacterized membrane protein YjjB (DUF3815 family)
MEKRLILGYITPIIPSLIVSTAFITLFQFSGMTGFNQSSVVSTRQIVITFGFSLLGLLGVTILYWLMKRSKDFEIRILVALIVAPTSAILVMVVSQTLLMIVAKSISTFMASIIVLISLYFAVFSIIFIISNFFSSRVRNFIFIIYGSLIGAFLSLILLSCQVSNVTLIELSRNSFYSSVIP